ncbi:hypothetical protein [Paraburkholderia sp.]|uniref:hypothetical protein n=1 Tax=Paraburkholderia sp. TaxID=1926495 RepID=UPI0025FC268A|nr:hypothetical protein [Paraburkholderia sp.]
MEKIKHTPGRWIRDHLTIIAEANGHVIARVGDAHHMLRGSEKREMQRECIENAKVMHAASDMLMVLELIAAEDDAARNRNRKPLLTSAVRMTLDAALIKAGRKAAPQPRFASTSCSSCGTDLGPGNAGVSSCADHAPVKCVRICGEGL